MPFLLKSIFHHNRPIRDRSDVFEAVEASKEEEVVDDDQAKIVDVDSHKLRFGKLRACSKAMHEALWPVSLYCVDGGGLKSHKSRGSATSSHCCNLGGLDLIVAWHHHSDLLFKLADEATSDIAQAGRRQQ